MWPTLYILAVSGIYVAVDRYAPLPQAQPQDPWTKLFFLGCYLFGGAIGWVVPELLAQSISAPWGDGWLERSAKVFGALGGFMIAARGVVVWVTLMTISVAGYLLILLIGYISGSGLK